MSFEYYILYSWRFFTARAERAIDTFAGYPLVIQICAVSITLICFAVLIVIMLLQSKYRKRHKEYRIINNLDSNFREPIKEIILETRKVSVDEVATRLNYKRSRPFTNREFRWFVRMLRDVRLECEDNANMENVQSIMKLIDFDSYMLYSLKHSSLDGKMRMTRSMRFLENHVKMDETISKLKKSKIVVLKKTAIFTYAWNNPNEALSYFDSETFEKYHCIYDMMIFHDIMKRNAQRGYSYPDLLAWVNTPQKKAAKPLFIREMRYLGINNKNEELVSIYQSSKDGAMNKEIVDCWNEFKYSEAEDMLIDTYSYQEESVQIAILRAINNFMTGKAGNFLRIAYDDAIDYDVKIEAIKALYGYYINNKLKADFDSLAKVGDEHLFKYFKEVG